MKYEKPNANWQKHNEEKMKKDTSSCPCPDKGSTGKGSYPRSNEKDNKETE